MCVKFGKCLQLEFDRLTLERERLEFEKAKMMERENRLRLEEKTIE